jgi:hypothetical protein
MLRRAAVIAAGLAMATSFGLAGAGLASAAAPALKIKPNAIWTLEVKGFWCEQDQFNTVTHTFVSDYLADAGSLSGGGATISMAWTAGGDTGLSFSGHFVSTTTPIEYKGRVTNDGLSDKAFLVKGAVTSFNGHSC